MYLSLGQAAKEAGVAKSTISKALSSGKLSYREKNSEGYKIDPAELFRVYPRTSKNSAEETASNDWQLGQASGETIPYSARFEIQLAGLKSLLAEKDRRITDLESDRAQLREDRHRLTENWQDERVRLLKLLEDQTGTVKLLTDEREKLVAEVQRTFWQRVFGRKPAGGIGCHLPRRGGGIFVASAKRVRIKACRPGGLRCLRPTRSTLRNR